MLRLQNPIANWRRHTVWRSAVTLPTERAIQLPQALLRSASRVTLAPLQYFHFVVGPLHLLLPHKQRIVCHWSYSTGSDTLQSCHLQVTFCPGANMRSRAHTSTQP